VDVRPPAPADQLRRQQMKTFIPGESPLEGVDEEPNSVERHARVQPTQADPFTAGRRVGAQLGAIPPIRMHACELWHKFNALSLYRPQARTYHKNETFIHVR